MVILNLYNNNLAFFVKSIYFLFMCVIMVWDVNKLKVKKGDVVKIMSFKHNGYIHRIWNKAYVLDVDKEKIVVCTKKTSVVESTGRRWYTREPAILYFYVNRWYNTIAMLRPDGVYYYTNLASPAVFDNGSIKYIDYDVDVKTVKHEKYKIMDMTEFYCHKFSMHYTNALEDKIMRTVDEVVDKFLRKEEPFCDNDAYNYYNNFKSD